jgi:Protein of unknown function (DUF1344)
MRKSLVIAAVAASFLSSAALAATATDTAAIKHISTSKHTVTLADGKVFTFPAAWKPTGFKIGDQVTVSYEIQNGKMVASSITHAS